MRLSAMMPLVILLCLTGRSSADDAKIPDRETLEKAFVDRLSGSALVGTFSVDGKPGAKPERYEIESVKKHKGDDWVVTARIKYGEHDLKVPMVVQVYWAGDTPMISLTNLTIPGLGTFTSRVMFHEHRYAGTWQHGDVGGHLWGQIEKADAKTEEKEKK
jgi:hypothetical protein